MPCEVCGKETRQWNDGRFVRFCSVNCRSNKYYHNHKHLFDKTKKREYDKQYRANNLSIIKEKKRIYSLNHKEQIKKAHERYPKWKKALSDKNYHKKKWRTDTYYKLKNILRNRLYKFVFDKCSKERQQRIENLIGCSVDELKNHLEKRFKEGMTWANHGELWHIDHILPCCAFDLTKESEQKECFNYRNLRPLYASENLSKRDTIDRKIKDFRKYGKVPLEEVGDPMQIILSKKELENLQKNKNKNKMHFEDAHISFVCEETKETIRKRVVSAGITERSDYDFLKKNGLKEEDMHLFRDTDIIFFVLE